MSSKREEERSFKRLLKAFPGKCCSLNCWYRSWTGGVEYYATVAEIDSNICLGFKNASDAVDDLISRHPQNKE